jgi:hypothetical protein
MKMGIVIVAAANGTRLKSKRPKVLYEIGRKTLLYPIRVTTGRASGLGVGLPMTRSRLNGLCLLLLGIAIFLFVGSAMEHNLQPGSMQDFKALYYLDRGRTP